MMRPWLFLLFGLLAGSSFAQNEVVYIWAGGVTPTSVNVNAKMTDTSSTIRLVLSANQNFTSPLYSGYYSVDTNTHLMVAMSLTGLAPGTRYYYAVESGGILDSSADDVGTFVTFQQGPCSYSFVTGSCCLNSNHGVYQAMGNFNPLFYSCIGDLHYANPNSATNINIHRDAYEQQVLSKPRAAAFFKHFPIEYVWDDHDFSGNDSDSSFAGKVNARLAYREYVPHYPLPAGPGNNPIYQTFTIGRVHFIHTDLRSDRYGSSMMGANQKAWFKNECIAARNNNEIICWISSPTWNGNFTDNWGGYAAERTELCNFFRDSLINNMFIICGDAHMLGIDDGTHGDFSSSVSNGSLYPIFNAAALNQSGGYKGGTFSEGGYYPNPSYLDGQFGLVSVFDNGGTDICIQFAGYRCDSSAGHLSLINFYSFCRELGAVSSNEPDASDGLYVFPNPSSGKVILQSEKPLEDARVLITGLCGTSREVAARFHHNTLEIDLSDYSPGVYFLTLVTGRAVLQKKIVLTR
jgi:alkaline phosphatase D